MGSELALSASVTVKASSSGGAIANSGPVSSQESWVVQKIIVGTDSALESRCAIYKNRIDASTLIATTESGNSDTDYQENQPLAYGETLYAVWVGATPGANCTITFEGKRTIGGYIYNAIR